MRNDTVSLTSQIASLFTNTVPLTVEDRCLVKCLRVRKSWNAFQMMREFPLRKWKNVLKIILSEKLTKPAQLTELQIAVAVALRERMKTFRSLRNSFAAKKANRFGLKEDTLTSFGLRHCSLVCDKHYSKQW